MKQIIVEDEDGEVVKTYELPPKQKPDASGPVMQSLKRMAGMSGKAQTPAAESSKMGAESGGASAANVGPVRQSLHRMGTWGFGGRGTETATEIAAEQEDDDRRIRFTIGGAGRRLTKDDFLKEIQSLDPKARSEVVAESDAPEAMKTMAKKDASPDVPGSNRLFSAMDAHIAPESGTASAIGAEMARRRGAVIEESDEEELEEHAPKPKPRTATRTSPPADDEDVGESLVERRRREKALRGTDPEESPRGRPIARDSDPERRGSFSGSGSAAQRNPADEIETAAEKRRREAALGFGSGNIDDDSDDDDTPRIPPPVAKSRGIRFAQSPVRGKR